MSDLALSTNSARTVTAAATPAATERASATVWISVMAAMIGAFMAILNIR
jgi:DHA2 family multidrug resistance protein